MDYFTDTLIFVISGVIIAGRICTGYQDSSPHILTGIDYAWAVALWLLLLVSPCRRMPLHNLSKHVLTLNLT